MRRRIPTFVPTSLSALARQVQEWARQVMREATDIRVITFDYADDINAWETKEVRPFHLTGPLRKVVLKRATISFWGINDPKVSLSIGRSSDGAAVFSLSLSGNGWQGGETDKVITPGAEEIDAGDGIAISVSVPGSGSTSRIRRVSVTVEYEDWSE